MSELALPFTATARKYGYVLWSKHHDTAVRGLLGGAGEVNLTLPGNIQQHKAVDWKHRRISVGYSVTRGLPATVTTVRLSAPSRGQVRIVFV